MMKNIYQEAKKTEYGTNFSMYEYDK